MPVLRCPTCTTNLSWWDNKLIPVWPSILTVSLAVIIPAVLQWGLMVRFGGEPWYGGPDTVPFTAGSLLLCTSIGFLFLALRWRRRALLIALGYFPAMVALRDVDFIGSAVRRSS